MIIALINWRIAPDGVDAFLHKWKTELSLAGYPGLIGEFLSKVEGPGLHQGITWEMEPDEEDDRGSWPQQDYVSYVNVGMWESAEQFFAAVGAYMNAGRTVKESFEAAPRRRAVVMAEHWRIGNPILFPTQNSPGVVL